MSGIMCAVVSATQNIVYTAGLFRVGVGADQSPITLSRNRTDVEATDVWIGYFRPASSVVELGLRTTRNNGGVVTGRLWLGSNAIQGDLATANIVVSNNNTATNSFTLVGGQYYPIRITWTYDLRGIGESGSIEFQVNSSTNVTNRIFYNSLSDGF
jgi:hypothetical protein